MCCWRRLDSFAQGRMTLPMRRSGSRKTTMTSRVLQHSVTRGRSTHLRRTPTPPGLRHTSTSSRRLSRLSCSDGTLSTASCGQCSLSDTLSTWTCSSRNTNIRASRGSTISVELGMRLPRKHCSLKPNTPPSWCQSMYVNLMFMSRDTRLIRL